MHITNCTGAGSHPQHSHSHSSSHSGFAECVVFLGLPDTQVSNTRPIWFLPSPPLALLSPCQRGLRVVATRCGVVRRRTRGRSTRHRPLHTLPSACLPRTTRLSRILPPTVNTRPRRTRGKEARRPLWAARWMDERRVQRILDFVLAWACTTFSRQWDRSVGPPRTAPLSPPVELVALFRSTFVTPLWYSSCARLTSAAVLSRPM